MIAAGEVGGVTLTEHYDFVICADGGYDRALSLGILPDLVIGDMDSVTAELPDSCIRLPREKDVTDAEAAISEAVSRGFTAVDMIGALGTRMDHAMANAFLTKTYLKKGVSLRIIDGHNIITATDSYAEFCGLTEATVSLIPADSAVRGVTLRGFYYPLENEDVFLGTTRTVSNRITADKATVTVREGTLLIILAKD